MCISALMQVSISILRVLVFVFFKQKTAYELRISDWSSDVCSRSQKSSHFRREPSHRSSGPGPAPPLRRIQPWTGRFPAAPSRPDQRVSASCLQTLPSSPEITAENGRASCRERVCHYV